MMMPTRLVKDLMIVIIVSAPQVLYCWLHTPHAKKWQPAVKRALNTRVPQWLARRLVTCSPAEIGSSRQPKVKTYL